MEQIPLHARPPYFVYDSYRPEWKDAFANWNHHTHSIPNLRAWLFDKIQYYATTELRDKKLKDEILATIMTASSYDKTCLELSPNDTIVTHMYVCELLNKVLLLFFGISPITHHGYSVKNQNEKNILDIFLESRNGVAIQLHDLFYDAKLPKTLPNLSEYLRFCPELIKETYWIQWIHPFVFEWHEGYSATWLHKASEHYHYCASDALIPSDVSAYLAINQWFFPEVGKEYSIADNQYTSFSVEERKKSDDFISTTSDIDGRKYLMWFWQSKVPKQRDIELRFYIIYLLGSTARYSPLLWNQLERSEPWAYLMIRRFIETNHIIYPFLVLRYITGRAYSFWWLSRYS